MGEREQASPEKDESTKDESTKVEPVVEEVEPVDAAEADAEAVEVEEAEIIEPVELSEAQLLQGKLEDAQARLRTVSKAYTDLQNEMAAFRDRMEHAGKMKADRMAFEAVAAFFEPVQNLKRSVESPADDVEGMLTGLQMVQKQFNDALHKLGLEPVPAEGAVFNPTYHEALAVTPVTDAEQDGKVLMVHKGGFLVNGKVLQAAQVVIGKYEEPVGEA